jgi:hypothetical protein
MNHARQPLTVTVGEVLVMLAFAYLVVSILINEIRIIP